MATPCYIVTGAGGAIGSAIVEALATQGKHVVMACRNVEKDTALRDRLNARCPGRVSIMELNLASLASIAAFARTIQDRGIAVQALINNAGAMCKRFGTTADGFETTVGVNFVGTYLLSRLLVPAIVEGGNIVFTTSMTRHIGKIDRHFYDADATGYRRFKSYSASKLATAILTAHLADELAPRGIRVNATDPGVVDSNMIHMDAWFDPLADRFFRPLISTPAQGAIGAVTAAGTTATGCIFNREKYAPVPARLRCHKLAQWLIAEADNRINRCASVAALQLPPPFADEAQEGRNS